MSTEVKYTDELGTEITLLQASQIKLYYETIVQNGQKLTNKYTNGSLEHTCYHISSQDEISHFLTLNPNACFNLKLTTINGYKIDESSCYQKGSLEYNKKFIIDPSDNLICIQEQKFDPVTSFLKSRDTEKFYTDDTGDLVYSFIYNRDGSCFSIEQIQINNPHSTIMANRIGVDPEITFTWSGFEYYQNAEPLIPN